MQHSLYMLPAVIVEKQPGVMKKLVSTNIYIVWYAYLMNAFTKHENAP